MTTLRRALAIVAAVLGLGAAVADPTAAGRTTRFDAGRDYLSAPDLADRIVRGDGALRVLDLRPARDFAELHIPTAVSAPLETLETVALPAEASVVVYANDEREAQTAWRQLRQRGLTSVFVVREGVYEWISLVLEPRLTKDATAAERAQFERAAALSRFFGGVPRANVDKIEVPVGYWNATGSGGAPADALRKAIAGVRGRGC